MYAINTRLSTGTFKKSSRTYSPPERSTRWTTMSLPSLGSRAYTTYVEYVVRTGQIISTNSIFVLITSRSHDTDSDDALDGLELFKAVLHARGAGAADKAGYADELRGGSSEPHVSEEAMRDVEGKCQTRIMN